MPSDIQQIITATQEAYRRFADGKPDRETLAAVRNAVTFLTADLTSAATLATGTREGK